MMLQKYKIIKKDYRRHIIKKRIWLCPPVYAQMFKDEFYDSNFFAPYFSGNFYRELADFKTIEGAYDALHQHAQLNGLTEIIVKEIL